MKNTLFLFTSFALLVFISSCQKEEGPPQPTSTFDKSQVESRTFSIGDSLKYDIEIIPNRPIKHMECYYNVGMNGYTHEIVQRNDSDEKFTYPFRFLIDQRFAGQSVTNFHFDVEFTTPESSGRAGTTALRFQVKLNQ